MPVTCYSKEILTPLPHTQRKIIIIRPFYAVWARQSDRSWQGGELRQTTIVCFGMIAITGCFSLQQSLYRVYWALSLWASMGVLYVALVWLLYLSWPLFMLSVCPHKGSLDCSTSSWHHILYVSIYSTGVTTFWLYHLWITMSVSIWLSLCIYTYCMAVLSVITWIVPFTIHKKTCLSGLRKYYRVLKVGNRKSIQWQKILVNKFRQTLANMDII